MIEELDDEHKPCIVRNLKPDLDLWPSSLELRPMEDFGSGSVRPDMMDR